MTPLETLKKGGRDSRGILGDDPSLPMILFGLGLGVAVIAWGILQPGGIFGFDPPEDYIRVGIGAFALVRSSYLLIRTFLRRRQSLESPGVSA